MMPSSFPAWVACLALVGSAPALSAQAAFTLDGTGTRVAYSGGSGTTAWALSPGFQIAHPWSSFGTTGTYAQFPDGSWSLRGQAAGSAFSRPVHGFRAEVGGSLAGTHYQDQSGSGQYAGTVRLHWLRSRTGGWIGGTAGRAWNGTGWVGTRRAELGGWLRKGLVSTTLTISPTAIGPGTRYTDIESGLQLTSGTIELLGSAGFRQWTGSAAGSNAAWVMGSATYWLGRSVALVASAGSYPTDYAQGLPRGAYGSLGFRLATGRPGVPAPRLGAQLLAASSAGAGGSELEVLRRSAETVTLMVTARDSETVELMGDFTGWSPVALTRIEGDRWSVTLPIPTGSHRMNIRIDGGVWDVPAGAPSLADEFSGVVGLLVIE